MAVSTRTVSVGTTATQLDAAEADANTGYSILVRNAGTSTIYLGGSDVDTSTKGYPLAAGESVAFDLYLAEHLYGIVASGTVSATVLQSGV